MHVHVGMCSTGLVRLHRNLARLANRELLHGRMEGRAIVGLLLMRRLSLMLHVLLVLSLHVHGHRIGLIRLIGLVRAMVGRIGVRTHHVVTMGGLHGDEGRHSLHRRRGMRISHHRRLVLVTYS